MFSNEWNDYFLKEAQLKSERSKDPSTQTGAILVRPDKTTCSTGYNGFPKSMPDLPEYYNDRPEKYSRIIHCEMNALIHAYEKVEGYTLYTWPLGPCDRCSPHLLQAGIKCFVFPECGIDRWQEPIEKTKHYIEQCGCVWIEKRKSGQYRMSAGLYIFRKEFLTNEDYNTIKNYRDKVLQYARSM